MDEPWRRRRGFDRFDWCFFGINSGVVSHWLLTIYSVTAERTGTPWPLYVKQATWIGVGAVAFLVVSRIDYHKLARWSYLLYGFALLLLVVVLIGGRAVMGLNDGSLWAPWRFSLQNLSRYRFFWYWPFIIPPKRVGAGGIGSSSRR